MSGEGFDMGDLDIISSLWRGHRLEWGCFSFPQRVEVENNYHIRMNQNILTHKHTHLSRVSRSFSFCGMSPVLLSASILQALSDSSSHEL